MEGSILTNKIEFGVKRRLYYLDNLKVFLTMLVIVHHVGQAYGPTGGFWQYKSSLNESIPWLGSFFGVNASFFMGLFFMISGYFLPGSYEGKGSRRFIIDKLIRYGIPLMFVFLIIQPLQMYFYYSLYSGNQQLDFFSYFINIYFGIGSKPLWFKETIGWPEMNFGHLWFVQHLLVYSLLYSALSKIFFRSKTEKSSSDFGYMYVILISILISVTSAVIRIWYPIDMWIGILGFIQSEVAHLPQYMILFICGIISFRKGWFDTIGKKEGYCFLAIGILMASIVYLRFLLLPDIRVLLFEHWAFYESFMAVFICWGLVVLFRERINYTTAMTKMLSENSYAAYIFHYPVVLAVQYSLDKVYIFGALGKFLTVSILSIVITYFISYLIRKAWYIRKVI